VAALALDGLNRPMRTVVAQATARAAGCRDRVVAPRLVRTANIADFLLIVIYVDLDVFR
jgi:hypothetical protein